MEPSLKYSTKASQRSTRSCSYFDPAATQLPGGIEDMVTSPPKNVLGSRQTQNHANGANGIRHAQRGLGDISSVRMGSGDATRYYTQREHQTSKRTDWLHLDNNNDETSASCGGVSSLQPPDMEMSSDSSDSLPSPSVSKQRRKQKSKVEKQIPELRSVTQERMEKEEDSKVYGKSPAKSHLKKKRRERKEASKTKHKFKDSDEEGFDEESEVITSKKGQPLCSVDSGAEEEQAEAAALPDPDDDLRAFVLNPVPLGCEVKCRITRDKRGIDKNLFPTYFLHVEKEEGKKAFLLASRKRKMKKTSNYLISTDATDLSRDSDTFVGKVRANMLGTQFTIYGSGDAPKDGLVKHDTRSELAACIYGTNILGVKGPRKMTVVLPEVNRDNKRMEIKPRDAHDGLVERAKREEFSDLLKLHNKAPVWNDDTQSYVLNFGGRVTQPSVKNFQIVHEDDENYIVMQFGRISEDVFTMDFRSPMCAVQAFGIALSAFDSKLACE